MEGVVLFALSKEPRRESNILGLLQQELDRHIYHLAPELSEHYLSEHSVSTLAQL